MREFPETTVTKMTPSQRAKVLALIRRFFKRWGGEGYEFSQIQMTKIGRKVSLSMTVRLRCEGTIGNLCPHRLHIFVGPRGGLVAYDPDSGKKVTGSDAELTSFS